MESPSLSASKLVLDNLLWESVLPIRLGPKEIPQNMVTNKEHFDTEIEGFKSTLLMAESEF